MTGSTQEQLPLTLHRKLEKVRKLEVMSSGRFAATATHTLHLETGGGPGSSSCTWSYLGWIFSLTGQVFALWTPLRQYQQMPYSERQSFIGCESWPSNLKYLQDSIGVL